MNAPLFGSCESFLSCQNCLQLADLNLLKNKIFCSVKKDGRDPLEISEPRYCSKVLHGNWVEQRAETKPIVHEWDTTYNTGFKPHNKENFNITPEDKSFAGKNKEKNQGIGHKQVLGHGGDAYHSNFSTTYDLTYRLLPSGLIGPAQRTYYARKDTYTPEQDLTQNFGNTTGYGLKEYYHLKEALLEEAMDVPRSSYQCDYVRKTLPSVSKRYPLISVDMNKPDLRYLDINMDKKWYRQYTCTHHKINLLQQRMCTLH